MEMQIPGLGEINVIGGLFAIIAVYVTRQLIIGVVGGIRSLFKS